MDSLSGMGVFVQVADAESLSVAARQLGVTPSAVSKTLTKLEGRLGVRLLHRTTRQVSLTEDGRGFLERCRRVLHEVKEAEAAVARSREEPAGRVRLACPSSLYHRLLAPRLPRLFDQHPLLSLEVVLRDGPTAPGPDADLAVGWSRPAEPQPGERVLAQGRHRVVAAPSWLARHGTPRTPEALSAHVAIGLLQDKKVVEWRFRRDGQVLALVPTTRLVVSSSEALVRAALEGQGLARLWDGVVAEELKKGTLVAVLDEFVADEVALVAVPSPGVGQGQAQRLDAVTGWLSACLAPPPAPARKVAARAH